MEHPCRIPRVDLPSTGCGATSEATPPKDPIESLNLMEPIDPIELRPICADDGLLIKRVRLRALADAPYAFGPNAFEQEQALPDSHWHRLAAQLGGQDEKWQDRCASFIAHDGPDVTDACATVTCYLCPEVARRAYVTAAWVDPAYRRGGVGRQLVDRAIAWAAAHGADHLRLWVDDTNPAAGDFYQALGFTPTGESQPVSDGSLLRQSCYERQVGGK